MSTFKLYFKAYDPIDILVKLKVRYNRLSSTVYKKIFINH